MRVFECMVVFAIGMTFASPAAAQCKAKNIFKKIKACAADKSGTGQGLDADTLQRFKPSDIKKEAVDEAVGKANEAVGKAVSDAVAAVVPTLTAAIYRISGQGPLDPSPPPPSTEITYTARGLKCNDTNDVLLSCGGAVVGGFVTEIARRSAANCSTPDRDCCVVAGGNLGSTEGTIRIDVACLSVP